MLPAYKQAASTNDYVFSIHSHANQICELVNDVSVNNKFDTMCNQVKTY